MKRHQIILLVCGVLMAGVCLTAGWFLLAAIGEKNTAAEERNQTYEELQEIFRAKVFPSDENIARVSENQKALESWLATASNLLHKGELRVESKSPTGFKQELQATVRELSAHPGTVNGKIVASGFNFGFDKYLGQSDSLPTSEHVNRLAAQLAIIDRVCRELFASNIMELKGVARETFDEGAAGGASSGEEPSARRTGRRRPRDDDDAAPAVQQKVAESVKSGYFSKQRFSFEFVARPAAFIEALNRLAAMDLFVVVAETEIRKTSDPLAVVRGAAKKDASGANVAVDPATLTHAERIVTDPELEPPVNVRLEVDVYSFEGV